MASFKELENSQRTMSHYWIGNEANNSSSWYEQGNINQQRSPQFDYNQSQMSSSTVPSNYYSQQMSAHGSNYYSGQMFIPSQNIAPSTEEDFENEPPLLEELGD
uniref:Protein YIPF n=1 Tax=Parascaris univalens TaxID=6257 RepID=A0A915B722_PARUN